MRSDFCTLRAVTCSPTKFYDDIVSDCVEGVMNKRLVAQTVWSGLGFVEGVLTVQICPEEQMKKNSHVRQLLHGYCPANADNKDFDSSVLSIFHHKSI